MNFFWIFYGPEDTQWAEEAPGGALTVVPTLVASRTTSLLHKYPNILETLGGSTKINSSHRKFQNHQIQLKHHHEGVHHSHWCLSDDA